LRLVVHVDLYVSRPPYGLAVSRSAGVSLLIMALPHSNNKNTNNTNNENAPFRGTICTRELEEQTP
jgi:hypothetical protein